MQCFRSIVTFLLSEKGGAFLQAQQLQHAICLTVIGGACVSNGNAVCTISPRVTLPCMQTVQCRFEGDMLCLLHRLNDGSQQWARFRFAPLNTVGAYQPTPNQTAAVSNQTFAVYPQLAQTRPWLLPDTRQWVPANFGNLSHAQVHVSPTRLLIGYSCHV